MQYLIIKEEVCPECNGNYKKLKEAPAEFNSRNMTQPFLFYCLKCDGGKVRTEVNLMDALKDLLVKRDNSFVEVIKQLS